MDGQPQNIMSPLPNVGGGIKMFTCTAFYTTKFMLDGLHYNTGLYDEISCNFGKPSFCLRNPSTRQQRQLKVSLVQTFLVNMRSRSAFSASSFSRRLRALACFCSWCFLLSVADLIGKNIQKLKIHFIYSYLILNILYNNSLKVQNYYKKSSSYHRFLEGDESFSCTCTTRPGVRLSASSTNSPHGTSRRDSRSSTQDTSSF